MKNLLEEIAKEHVQYLDSTDSLVQSQLMALIQDSITLVYIEDLL